MNTRPYYYHFLIFTALHRMQTRSSDENSVCLSVKRVICDKMKESCAHILIPQKDHFSKMLLEQNCRSSVDIRS